jgi:hypothetical protein
MISQHIHHTAQLGSYLLSIQVHKVAPDTLRDMPSLSFHRTILPGCAELLEYVQIMALSESFLSTYVKNTLPQGGES